MSKQCLFCKESLCHDLAWHHLFMLGPVEFSPLCKTCQQLFHPIKTKQRLQCDHCLRPLEEEGINSFTLPHFHQEDQVHYCFDCYQWRKTLPIDFLRHDVLLEYNDSVREWLYMYKYQGDVRQAKVVTEYLKKAHHRYKDYVWTVLPSSYKHLNDRLFHPTGLLLKEASIPYQEVFDYIGDNERQAAKTKGERLKLKQPFKLKESAQLPEKLLIFDDLYTTGATIMKAKECLFDRKNNLDLISLSLARDSLQED